MADFKNSASTQQRGAVLVIGLLMLLILTLVGVASMKSSVLDERIAANSQFRMMAFQASESALAQYATPDAIDAFVKSGDTADLVANTTYEVNASAKDSTKRNVKVEVRIRRDGDATPRGTSLNVGGQQMVMRVYRFTAEAEVADTRAKAIHHLALGRLEPVIEGQQ